MDQQELQNKIGEYYSRLPEKAKAEFARMEWMNVLHSLSEKYKLTDMQVQTLGIETTLFLLGIINREEYEALMMTELAVAKEVADAILKDVNENIIKGFGDDFKTVYESNVLHEGEVLQKAEEMKNAPPVPLPPQKQPVAENKIPEQAKTVPPPMNIPITSAPTAQIPVNPTPVLDKILEEKPSTPAITAVPNISKDPFTSAGIEMMEEKNEPERAPVTEMSMKADESVLSRSGIGMIEEKRIPRDDLIARTETQKEVLSGIENPPSIPTSIIADKLGGVTSSTPAPAKDPYREIPT